MSDNAARAQTDHADEELGHDLSSCCGALLAQNAEQPELERHGLMDAIPAGQGTVLSVATQAVSPLWGVATSSYAVNQLLKRSAENLHATFCGSQGRVTAPATWCTGQIVS